MKGGKNVIIEPHRHEGELVQASSNTGASSAHLLCANITRRLLNMVIHLRVHINPTLPP